MFTFTTAGTMAVAVFVTGFVAAFLTKKISQYRMNKLLRENRDYVMRAKTIMRHVSKQ